MAIKLSVIQRLINLMCGRQVESGLLGYDGITAAPPLRIYLGTTVDGYLSGGGTPMPETNPVEYEHLFDFAPGDCSKTMPVLDGGVSYPSQVYLTSAGSVDNDNAMQYTGLMRLAVQAKIGAGRSQFELAPWPLDYTTCGIVRADDYTYYSVRVLPDGVTVALMHSELECVRDWLDRKATLGISADDAIRFESYLLSTLRPANESDGDTLEWTPIDAVGMKAIYAGKAHLCHGWNWSTTECSTVTLAGSPSAPDSDWYYDTALGTITFAPQIDDAGCGAALAIVESGALSPSTNQLWYPVGNGMQRMEAPDGKGFSSEASGPFYAFYQDEELQVCRLDQQAQTTAGGDPGTWHWNLYTEYGATVAEDEASWDEGSYIGGGFSVGAIAALPRRTDQEEVRSKKFELSKPIEAFGMQYWGFALGTTGTWTYSNGTDYPSPHPWFDEPCGNPYLKTTLGAWGYALDTQITESKTYTSSARLCLISGGSPDAVYLVGGDYEANHRTEKAYSNRGLPMMRSIQYGDGGVGEFINSNTTTGTVNAPAEWPGPAFCNVTECDDGSSGDSILWAYALMSWRSLDIPDVTNETTNTNTTSMMSRLVAGSGTYTLPEDDWGAWAVFWASTTGLVSNTLPVTVSHGGDIRYFAIPTASKLMAGYSAEASAKGNLRFVGWA